MREILHTMPCPLVEFAALDLTFNLGLTGEEYDAAQTDDNRAPALVDIPNWETEAEGLGLPRDKPAFPLTIAALNRMDMLLTRYLTGSLAVSDALDHRLAQRSPNSRRS